AADRCRVKGGPLGWVRAYDARGAGAACPMARRSERLHLGEGSLLVLFLDQNAILADFPSEGPVATEVLSGPPLMALGVANALADPFPLELGDRSEDGEHKGFGGRRRFQPYRERAPRARGCAVDAELDGARSRRSNRGRTQGKRLPAHSCSGCAAVRSRSSERTPSLILTVAELVRLSQPVPASDFRLTRAGADGVP